MPKTKPSGWYWCITANNEDKEDVARLLHSTALVPAYYILGNEQGEEEHTPHVQGYVEFKKEGRKNGYRLTQLKAISARWHWEKRQGTQQEAIQYITGPHEGKHQFDEAPLVYGTPTEDHQGERTDLQEVVTAIKGGWTIAQIAEGWPETYIRMGRGIRELHMELSPRLEPMGHPPEVHICFGPAGTGKTTYFRRYLERQNLLAYTPLLPTSSNQSMWFDHYRNEPVIWLRDFEGQMPFDILKDLCDIYPLPMQTKHGSRMVRPTHILIDSNMAPRWWYPKRHWSPADTRAIIRRTTEVARPYCIVQEEDLDDDIGDPTPREYRFHSVREEAKDRWLTENFAKKY